jgi:hypothetical protein
MDEIALVKSEGFAAMSGFAHDMVAKLGAIALKLGP